MNYCVTLSPGDLMRRSVLALLAVLLIVALSAACGGGDDSQPEETADATDSPSVSAGTPLPPDPEAAVIIFQEFVESVQAGDVEHAWRLYTASIGDTTEEHNAEYGCDFGAFSYEFPRMQNLFSRVAPLEVTQTHGAAPGSLMIELRLLGANGTSFLGTLQRVRPDEEYRVRFLNNGEVSAVPGAPDGQPSPDDPIGVCGIWAGTR